MNEQMLIGKKVKLKESINKKEYTDLPYLQNLIDYESIIVFVGRVIGMGGDGIFVGLENRGELVIVDGNLRLFLWSDDKENILHDFEEVKL